MTSITLYGGANEIGGNKVLLRDGDTQIFLDFGFNFSRREMFFDEFLQPRNTNGLGDYFELGLFPKIEGLYREDGLIPTDLDYCEPRFQGILPSHPHIDHIGGIPFTDWSIPVYCSETTKRIIELIETTSRGGVQCEYLRGRSRPFGDATRIHWSKWEVFQRRFDEIDRFGEFRIEAYELDHSIRGSYGLLLHTNGGTVAYTGDLRLHGPRGSLTRSFIESLMNEDIEALIIEGTRVEEKKENVLVEELIGKRGERLSSIEEVKEKSIAALSDTDKPVFVDFNSRDFDTLRVFYEVAKESGRKLVLPFKIAYAVKALPDLVELEIDDEDLVIYKERKGLGSYDRRDRYQSWERDLLDMHNARRYEWIRSNLSKLVVHLSYYNLQNLVDLKPDGGIYINASTEPFNEEMALDFKRLDNWRKRFNLEYRYFHASGHLSKEEVFRFIEDVNPRKVIPIHTEGSRVFEKKFENVILPRVGVPIEL